MKCPIHKKAELKQAIFHDNEVDYCPTCLGIWFDQGEFRIAKDSKDKNLDWIDVDLWESKTKFEISKDQKSCPSCEVPMYEISYGDSDVKVDICNLCKGLWLDRGEFKKTVDHLREKSSKEVVHNYLNVLFEESTEVFTGPESLQEELSDVVTVLGLLKHRVSVKHPIISEIISRLPKV